MPGHAHALSPVLKQHVQRAWDATAGQRERERSSPSRQSGPRPLSSRHASPARGRAGVGASAAAASMSSWRSPSPAGPSGRRALTSRSSTAELERYLRQQCGPYSPAPGSRPGSILAALPHLRLQQQEQQQWQRAGAQEADAEDVTRLTAPPTSLLNVVHHPGQ